MGYGSFDVEYEIDEGSAVYTVIEDKSEDVTCMELVHRGSIWMLTSNCLGLDHYF